MITPFDYFLFCVLFYVINIILTAIPGFIVSWRGLDKDSKEASDVALFPYIAAYMICFMGPANMLFATASFAESITLGHVIVVFLTAFLGLGIGTTAMMLGARIGKFTPLAVRPRKAYTEEAR